MKQATSEIGSYEVDRSTHFLFEHKVFTLKGARFALTEDGSTPAFHVELGALVASLPMGTLRAEFSFDRDLPDGVLLAIVEKSLRLSKRSAPVTRSRASRSMARRHGRSKSATACAPKRIFGRARSRTRPLARRTMCLRRSSRGRRRRPS